MKSLYINTTGRNLNLGFKDGDDFRFFESDGILSQSEEIFPAIMKILGQNKISDLDFIVCLGGPGSFTGIRLGLSIVKGFNIAVGVPVITLNNFMASFYSIKDKVNEFYIALSSGVAELFVSKFSSNGKVLEEGKLVKKDSFQPLEKVYFDTQIDTKAVLFQVEKNFDKKSFKQGGIEPTYIKPHYAKVKAK
ncbi:MAG: tRNA (adenosine(37)-N6)-threonylcarbamoyltransferase complex dimerization subunit type 1 TsaB [Alphaproteobacteria bacterium]|nr:tRNA (adenosine(37)-N6)-threonylcarbamoyltransferase complex dimerization subunit type 1 TsaB [Alphaproteobacteria bacterium]